MDGLANVDVNVCCITYNHEKYIEQALNGILMQKTNFRWNIIIHDDASTDDTQKVIKLYKKRFPDKIITILQSENQYSKGRNPFEILTPYLNGKYIAVCEGDDYWIDDRKLQKQYDFLQNNRDYIACYHNVKCVDKKNVELTQCTVYPKYREHTVGKKEAIKFKLPGQTASSFYRNIYKEMSLQEKEIFYHGNVNLDRKLAIYLGLTGKILCMEDTMAAYRIVNDEGDSWSAKSSGKNMLIQSYDAQKEMKNFVKSIFNIDVNIDYYLSYFTLEAFLHWLKTHERKDKEIYDELKKRKDVKIEKKIINYIRAFKMIIIKKL